MVENEAIIAFLIARMSSSDLIGNSVRGLMKILVIDDDDIALLVAKKILENDNYEVVIAKEGETALEILKSGTIKIVISDWNMPRINGIELCRQVRAFNIVGYIYFILVTVRSSKEDMLAGLSAGADDFISKPFEPAELLVRVRNAERVLAMERDLRQSEARNSALLSAIPDSILRIRRDGVFLDHTAGSSMLFNIPDEEINGSHLNSLLSDPLVDETLISINKALHTEEIQTMEFILKIGDSSHVFETRLKNSGADEVIAIIRDISGRARLDQMKSDFINRATHELRTPIATMLLMANLIDGHVTKEEYNEYWAVLKTELRRERMLVEDLLSAGRLESNQAHMHFRVIDVSNIIKESLRQFEQPAREKNIRISSHFSDELDETAYFIMADESALSQVFVNLLGNAIKFTPNNGKVDVFMKRHNDGLDISIRDTGMGIPSEDIPLLFNRFFRASNAINDEIPGTGIGLYIVRSILEKHGGTIKVHSEVNSGTEFEIWLPDTHLEQSAISDNLQ